jgi:Zn finger protein HypA/HybF involved in hydrogenase expression
MPREAQDIATVKSEYGKRYRTDPEFRTQCLDRLKEKVECENCFCLVSRVNLKRHKTSRKCIDATESIRLESLGSFASIGLSCPEAQALDLKVLKDRVKALKARVKVLEIIIQKLDLKK